MCFVVVGGVILAVILLAVSILKNGRNYMSYEADQIQILEGLEAVRKGQVCISIIHP